MELILEEKSISANSMRNCHKIMLDIFGEDVELVEYWGPVQMCVFYLEYHYSPRDYKIIMECERGFIVIEVQDKAGNVFWPLMVFPKANYFHYADVEKYEETIEYIKELIEKENFILVEGNCPIGEHKKDGYWIDDIIYHVIKCPKCGWEFTCIVNTYRGGGSFTRGR